MLEAAPNSKDFFSQKRKQHTAGISWKAVLFSRSSLSNQKLNGTKPMSFQKLVDFDIVDLSHLDSTSLRLSNRVPRRGRIIWILTSFWEILKMPFHSCFHSMPFQLSKSETTLSNDFQKPFQFPTWNITHKCLHIDPHPILHAWCSLRQLTIW